jgi:hypothetical protein
MVAGNTMGGMVTGDNVILKNKGDPTTFQKEVHWNA